jgi:hypothetical protein
MNIFKSILKMEMSKKFASVVLLVWIASVVMSYVTNSINPIVDYTNESFKIILISYFGKSTVEFITRVAGKVPTPTNNKNNNIDG